MNLAKQKSLEYNYERILNVGFCLTPYEDLSDIIGPDPVVFGTTKDEKILSLKEVDALFKSQYEQMGDMKPGLDRNRIASRISPDGNNAFIVEEITLTLSSSEEVKSIFMRASCVMEYDENQWKLTHWHTSTPVDTENDHWHQEEWKREKERLQELVDRQTDDLLKKNRELEIETALERVRARTMAMHSSDELAEASSLLFEQMEALGVETFSSGFTIWDQKKGELISWMCNADGSMNPPFRMPIEEEEWHKEQYESWVNGEEFIVKDMSGDQMKSYFRYLRSFPLLDEAFKTSESAGHPMPERQVHHVANFSHGNLLFITLKPVPDAHDIFKRFAKVFDQTYTRFLDLKKAEAQARETQIEMALERVRSRSMAMQKSDELNDVAFVLFEQLRNLGGEMWGTGFVFCEENKDEDVAWFAVETGILPPVSIPNTDDPTHAQMYAGWKENKDFISITKSGKELEDHYEYMLSLPKVRPFFQQILDSGLTFPKKQQWNAAYYKHGYLLLITTEEYSDPDILKRFAKVFEQSYTRFEDLKKAEAQAREAQINLAVERVRAKALAMYKSDEILEVVNTLKNEIIGLDIPSVSAAAIHLREPDGRYRIWDLTTIEDTGNGLDISLDITYRIEDTHPDFFMREVWERTEDYYVVTQGPNRYPHTVQWLRDNGHAQEAQDFLDFIDETNLDTAYHPTVVLQNGRMSIDMLEKPTPEVGSILKKMGQAFDLAYKRFEDLKKAEAQTREAKIETALEKVRSRTMGMQKGEELKDVVVLLYKELIALGVTNFVTCGYVEVREEQQIQETWVTSPGGDEFGLFYLPLTGDDTFDARYAAWKAQEPVFHQSVAGQVRLDHLEYAITKFNSKEAEEMVRNQFPDPTVFYCFNFTYGYLHIVGGSLLEKEEEDLLVRFTKVFEQTYTRFLDLQKAEAQAREAKIEAGLEKIRSRTMGMQNSDELPEVANLLFLEIQALGIHAWSCGYCILEEDGNSSSCIMSSEGTVQKPFLLPHRGEASFEEWDDFVHSENTFFVQELKGEALESHYGFMKSLPQLTPIFQDLQDEGLSLPTYQINHLCKFSNGFLLFITYEKVPKAHDIFKRFTSVFDQTYTRFLDLKKSEQRAREAEIELALERIRSKVSAMQKSSDLLDIVVTMRTEFISLGHEAHYFWYMRWLEDKYEKAMTSGDGSKIGMIMTLPRKIHAEIESVVRWEMSDEPYMVLDMGPDMAVDYVNKMITLGDFEQVDPQAPSLDDVRHIGGLTFIMARTRQGEIGYSLPGVVPNPPKNAIETLVRFAGVFDLAYQRFEDLKEAEQQAKLIREERDRLEATLKELHATQDQLIQQEKLASLGQLTAGIAHEIKNPLNFVNNFSDLSVELIQEARDEIKSVGAFHDISLQDDVLVELYDILNNVEMNLQKIHEHGSRADGIVKSMLEHSRGGSGIMEPSDLNALVKEFTHLSFHGMRASKNPINVDIEFDLDDSIGVVPLVTEDFSRVIVNLCNNAFDAMREKLTDNSRRLSAESNHKYEPKLTVRTISDESSVAIEIEDNGSGIPAEIKDKIMQPFFTTKKGTDGTGLGLSITNDIIKAHGGKLEVSSSESEGTIFTINLFHGE